MNVTKWSWVFRYISIKLYYTYNSEKWNSSENGKTPQKQKYKNSTMNARVFKKINNDTAGSYADVYKCIFKPQIVISHAAIHCRVCMGMCFVIEYRAGSVSWCGHARSPGAARLSRRREDGGRGCGGGSASETTRGVWGDSRGFVPGITNRAMTATTHITNIINADVTLSAYLICR